jgi:phage terminase large subunit-like protein
MIGNRWVRGEGDFLQEAWIEACTKPELRPSLGDSNLPIFVGVDASTKHDWCAVVATAYDDDSQKVRLVKHYVWKPTPDKPLDFVNTIERAVLELQERFWLTGVYFDPWQLSALAQRLTDAGLSMEEFPQTLGNLTAMGENLLALFKDRNIEIYADGDLAQSLRNAVGIESSRGFKIGKAAAARKIDLVVALAMSALAAVRHERAGWGMFQYTRQRAEMAARGETPVEDTSLADEYWKVRNELERMSENSLCLKCKKPLGPTKTLNTDGKYYHPECARGW